MAMNVSSNNGFQVLANYLGEVLMVAREGLLI